MANKLRHLSIHSFTLFLALPMLVLFGLVFWFVFRDLESIRTLAFATSREYLPRILAKQQLLINIENLRRNISLAYHSGDPREARNADITAQALMAESVFGESAEFSAMLERIKPEFKRLQDLKKQLFNAEDLLHDGEIAFSSVLGRLTLRTHIQFKRKPTHQARHRLDSRSQQNDALKYEETKSELAPLMKLCVEAEAGEDTDPGLQADCRAFRKSWDNVTQGWQKLVIADAESQRLWENIDNQLRELSDYASTSEASQIARGMTHIDEETARIRRLFLVTGAMLLLGMAVAALLVHLHILRPLALTSRALDAIRSGQPHPILPPVRIRELQNMLDVLPGLTRYMEELNARSGRLERERDQYADMSFRDALTGISNRRALETVLASDIPGTPLALLMLDLDLFKKYNDIFGHQQGDIALKAVAEAVKNALLRPSDMAFRYGGEEFTVLLAGADQSAALTVARRIMDNMRNAALPHPEAPAGIITVSIGISCRAAGENTPVEELLALADQALYRSKEAGRNTITLSTGKQPDA